MAVDSARAKSLFLAASELADPAERAAYLERECGGDAPLRERVEALLRANDDAPWSPPGGIAATVDSAGGPPPTRDYADLTARVGSVLAGKYKLLEEIGAGGMGSVFMAQQTEPVKRMVAVKVVKAGMDSKAVLARFEAERQALALMDHPNIAKVLDAGATEAGRPYFVMELVNGIPLTDYCDQQHLTTRERLELFIPICQAVQHAHQKGIIHRDLKPSNILVALYDGRPVPKVIDFGVAKATNQRLTEKTMFTGLGQIIGTLEYMSPEQAQRNQLDVDTRSDIYSLGVVLYELLTGEPPFDRERLRSAAFDELLRMIRHEEPPRPSTRLSSSASLPSIAANRRIDPARLGPLLRGELDWIVMKTLEKDRARRYETANGLARDIQRFLADEPVEACPPTLGYRVRKYVHKHRAGVFTATAMALLLITGTTVSTWQAYRARKAETKALEAAAAESRARNEEARQRKLAEENERAAREQSARAVAEKQVADAVREFLQVNLLRQADAQTQAGSLAVLLGQFAIKENPTVRELLDRAMVELAEDLLETKFPDQPLVQAEILRTIGDSYRGIGDNERAAEVLERASQIAAKALAETTAPSQGSLALGDMAELISLECDNSLGVAYLNGGRTQEAGKIFARLSEQSRDRLGPTHMRTVIARLNWADFLFSQEKFAEAATIFEDTLDLLKKNAGPADPMTLATMEHLAKVYLMQGRTTEAVSLLEGGLKLLPEFLPEDDPLRLSFLEQLASASSNLGHHDRAIELLTIVYNAEASQRGSLHPDTLVTACNLAGALLDSGRVEEAISKLEQLQPDVERQLGRLHPNHLILLGRLSQAYQTVGRSDLASKVYERFTIDEMLKLDLNQQSVLTALNNLASVEYSAGRKEEARKLLEKIRDHKLKRLGPEHSSTLVTLTNLATTYQALGRLPEALETLQPVAATLERKFGFDDAKTLKANLNLALILWKLGRKDEGLELARRVVETSRRVIGESHLDTIDALEHLAELKRENRELASAAMDLEHVCEVRTRVQGTSSKVTWDAVRSLARICQDQARWNDAITRWEELVAWQSVAEQRDARQWLRDKFALAAAYKQAGRPADALPVAQQVLSEQRTLLGEDDPETLATLSESGFLCWRLRKFDEAIPKYRELLERTARLKGESHAETIKASINLAVNQRDAGQLEAAQSTVATWLGHWRTELKDGHPDGVFGIQAAISIEVAGGRLAEAEGLHRELVAHWRRTGDTGALNLASALAWLGANLLDQKKFGQAETEIAEALDLRAQRIPDDWMTFSTQAMLGGAILEQARLLKAAGDARADAEFARAAPLLRSGYEGMKAREQTIPPHAKVRLTGALERLVEVYTALNNSNEIKKWQAELDQHKATDKDQETNPTDPEPTPPDGDPPCSDRSTEKSPAAEHKRETADTLSGT